MQLHQIKRENAQKDKRTRVGRGGKRGTTSGKGTKGQKSRSGHRIRPAIRDLIQRTPKLRGYANKIKSEKPYVVNLDDIMGLKLTTVSMETLIKAKVITHRNKVVKILGGGDITAPVTVTGIKTSAEAKKKIEAAGGKVN